MTPKKVDQICENLQSLQRWKMRYRKPRIRNEVTLVHTIAGSLGYESRMDEKKRAQKFKEAASIIKGIISGELEGHEFETLVLSSDMAADAFRQPEEEIVKEMKKQAKKLPVYEWLEESEQRGFGLGDFATIIGESGSLSNYPNPAKLWRRMGCAPFQKGNKTQMGSSWRSKGGLSAAEWEEFGYSPKRRSIVYVMGTNILKGNKSVYRDRYDETKARFAENHPDASKGHCHNHAMLLMSKLLLKNLWIEWHRQSR